MWSGLLPDSLWREVRVCFKGDGDLYTANDIGNII
jgi:hypothetical protein